MSFRFRPCGVVVVLLVINLSAVLVLFLVDLLALLPVEGATVGGAIVVHLLVDAGLVGVGAGSFAGGFLTGAEALRGALLLVGFTVVDCVGTDRVGIVVFVVDLTAGVVLLAVDLLTFLVGEGASVGDTVVVDLLVDVGLGAIGAGSFARGHLAGAETVGNALVLICLAIVGVIGLPGRAVGGRDGLRLYVLLGDLVVSGRVGGSHGGWATMVDGG